MTEQCYYIGIDMDDRNAVISYYKAGMREPETLSTITRQSGSPGFPRRLAKRSSFLI